MVLRLFLAAALSLPCLAVVGCGGSPAASMPNPEAKAEPLSAAELAETKAEMERVNAEESAYQNADAPAKPAGKTR